jgi:hypothetical protein
VSFPGPTKAAALKITPMTTEDCSDYFKNRPVNLEKKFCAIFDEIKDMYENYSDQERLVFSEVLCKNTCQQRHGETVLHFIEHLGKVSAVVVGLSSATNYCDLEKPLVFTRLSAYKEWIESFLS